ncbi:G-protein coupled receptor 15-like [Brienomyrus brachyistius]|uniref:G-protein coupled receptor 15-like n=1 Tax=Brienomyrus brachyistius TaxID=42636 RepID=UPI0020B20685|nr:G-protein coupled receptor 15-like [Brienomyrus brachyistius]
MGKMENNNSMYYYNMTEYDYETLDLPQSLEDNWSAFKIILLVLYALVFCSGIFGNILVIYLMMVKNKQQRLVDVFITHLAVADLVFLVTLPLWIISLSLDDYWPFGDFLCKFSSYVISVNMFSSIFLLTCMSADRFMAIVMALNTRRMRTKRYAHLTVLMVWITSLILGSHSFHSRAVKASSCQDTASPTKVVFTLMTRVIAFLLPLVIITFCYSAVALKLYQHFQVASKAERKKRRSIRIGLCILALFVLTWLPFNILHTVLTLKNSGFLELSEEAFVYLAKSVSLATCLAFSNSCMNPLLYFWMDSYMRKKVVGLLPKRFLSIPTKRNSELSTSTTYPEKDSITSKEKERARYTGGVQISVAGKDTLQEQSFENVESQL